MTKGSETMISQHKKTANQKQSSEGTFSVDINDNQHFNGTEVSLKYFFPEGFILDVYDANWHNNNVLFIVENANNTGQHLKIGADQRARAYFAFWVGGGFYRLAYADRGELTYFYNLQTKEIHGTFWFEIDDEEGQSVAYSFTNGKFRVKELNQLVTTATPLAP